MNHSFEKQIYVRVSDRNTVRNLKLLIQFHGNITICKQRMGMNQVKLGQIIRAFDISGYLSLFEIEKNSICLVENPANLRILSKRSPTTIE
jgi:hypothetical protein